MVQTASKQTNKHNSGKETSAPNQIGGMGVAHACKAGPTVPTPVSVAFAVAWDQEFCSLCTSSTTRSMDGVTTLPPGDGSPISFAVAFHRLITRVSE